MTLDSALVPTVNSTQDSSDPAIQTRNFSIRNGRQTVIGALSLDIPVGALFVVSGRFASGKTALLLALAGRLRGFSGTATVFGHSLRSGGGQVRHVSALAETPIVNRLDDDLTVERQIAAALVLRQPWWKPLVSHKAVALCLVRVNALLREVDARAGDLLGKRAAGLPRLIGTDRIVCLQPLDRAVLGVVVALIGRPRLLIVDDVDTLRDTDDRTRAWAALLTLRIAGWHDLTIAASGQDPKELFEILERIDDVQPAPARPVCLLDLDSAERTLTALTRKA
ncbi:ABC-type multidrug transport system ATPase subunit [Cryobacterium sp. CAN_C3]|uniref:hypothetical protein n=1 Tax=unclassified Cryobacterium TaxID=2649013 RepID=UPI0018CA1429|nr:hypothetical protein [Cryobacterium sp. CAN_C3]MEC5154393.1 ABC-type multidrug transport system ATPase subunit [Cryobacterium sp. CAN_C3]